MNARSRRTTSLIILSAIVLAAVGVTVGVTLSRSSEDGVPAVSALPDTSGMGDVELRVADLDAMVEFYAGGVGLDVIERDEAGAVLGEEGAQHERTDDALTVLDPWGTRVVVRVA